MDVEAIKTTNPDADSNTLPRIQSFMPEEDAAVKSWMLLHSLVNNNGNAAVIKE